MTQSLAFRAELSGIVNAGLIELSGQGTIDPNLGTTDGTYVLRAVPARFDPFVLSACLITGYPNVSASVDGSPNPFTGHRYSYRRTLRFRDGGALSLSARCEPLPQGLDSHFELKGDVDVEALAGVEPIVEVWEPHGPGEIRGHFVISWPTHHGTFVTADAMTEYTIDSDVTLPEVLHRHLHIQARRDGCTLRKYQVARLRRAFPAGSDVGNGVAIVDRIGRH